MEQRTRCEGSSLRLLKEYVLQMFRGLAVRIIHAHEPFGDRKQPLRYHNISVLSQEGDHAMTPVSLVEGIQCRPIGLVRNRTGFSWLWKYGAIPPDIGSHDRAKCSVRFRTQVHE